MTRKDYILLAEALRSARGAAEYLAERKAVDFTASRVAQALQGDNPRFDMTHFMAVVRGERELQSRPARPTRWEPDIARQSRVGYDLKCKHCGEGYDRHHPHPQLPCPRKEAA